jgi:hypothetical protein
MKVLALLDLALGLSRWYWLGRKEKMSVAPLPKVEHGLCGYPNGALNFHVRHDNLCFLLGAAGEPSDALINKIGLTYMILSDVLSAKCFYVPCNVFCVHFAFLVSSDMTQNAVNRLIIV